MNTYKRLTVLLLVLLGFVPLMGQTNSVELKNGSGTVISRHSSVDSAVDAIPATISQAYIVEITSSYTGSSETFPIVFPAKTGASATNTITLRPASGVTNASITGAYATTTNGMITIDDGDYVIIDGRAGGTGTSKNLTISNTNTAATAAIMFINGATNNKIRYCNLAHASTGSAGRSIAFSTSASNTTGNSDNLVEHCKMNGGRYVIQMAGTAANPNSRNKIYGCELYNLSYAGIYQSGTGTGALTVDSCSFYTTVASTTTPTGMYMLSVTDSLIITRNKMYDISVGTGTSSVYGIYISSVTGTTYVRIANNFISLSANTGSTSLQGIYLAASGLYNADVYFNTVRISGTLSSGSSSGTVASSAFYKTSGNAGSIYNIKNNIFINERTGGTSGAQHLAAALTSVVGTINWDYNTLNTTTTGQFSRWGATLAADLAAHQALVPGNAPNDNDKPVTFVSTNDLHLAGLSLGDLDLKATNISFIQNDIDNQGRGSRTYRGGDDNPAYPLLGNKNDIGVISIDEPLPAVCSTPATVKVTVKNFGTNQVDTFTVNWSINGTLQSPVTFYVLLDTVLGSNPITKQVTLGTVAMTTGTNYLVKAWTSKPNTLIDPEANNDSSQRTFRMALPGGTYTVGGTSPDFATLNDMAFALNNYGICGPVIMNIRNGTYNEKFSLDGVPGSSATNTITIQSETGNKNAVTITSPSSASTTDNYTIRLNGTDYLTLRNITASRTGTAANATVIDFEDVCESVTITGNTLRGITNTATDANGVRSNIYGGTTAVTHNLVITNNLLDNNSNGVWLNTSTTTLSRGVKINDNTVAAHYTGIFVAGEYNPEIRRNNITRFDQTINVEYYGISMNIIDSAYLVERNYIETNRGYGIRLRDCNGYGGKEGQVINNMVVMEYAGTSTVYGISNETGGSYQLYAHNTCLINDDYTSTSTTAGARVFYMPVTTVGAYKNIRILNNIFYNGIDGVAAWFTTQNITAVTELDYNLYYSGATNLCYITNYYTDFASYKTATGGKEVHGYNFAPTFAGSKNPHILFMQKFAFGRNDLGITQDFDGDTRCVPLPTVGADEYNSGLGAPNATFMGPATAVKGDRAYFLFNGNIGQIAVYNWYVNGVYVAQTPNFVYTFPTTGTFVIKQVAENCSGKDSATKTYTIANPTTAPTANFSADRNQIFMNEGVKMTDLSINGPTAWHWSVTPDNGVVFSDSLEQDPTILFTEPGKYEICLIADNSIGSSAQRCRTAYIEVFPLIDMCTDKISTTAKGKLFDDGGSASDYAANQNCAFFINPCASEVTLKFKKWVNTDADDKLLLYDGDTTNPANLITTIIGGMTDPGGSTGFKAKSGRMWLVWKTDAATQDEGFEVEWESIPASANPTVAGFTVKDTAFEDSPVDFTNTSTGSGLTFSWDFDSPNFEPDDQGFFNTVNPTKTFSSPGIYTVSLESNNCLGKNVVMKDIVVITPTKKPAVNFTAAMTKLNINEVNQLMDMSANGPSSWKWQITPSSGVLFLDPVTSRNPRVVFSFGGKYTVKLVATNIVGADSLTKTAYIEVLEYCKPNVLTVNTDVTLRRVVFRGIDQSSDFGVSSYTDFTGNGQTAGIALGGTYNISIERNTNNERVNYAVWLDMNQDGDFEDSAERVLFDSASTAQILNTALTLPTKGLTGLTRMRVGISRANFTTLPCGPVVVGEYEDYKVNISADDKAPVITLNGPNPQFIEIGYGFTDSGAIAIDNVDGNISNKIIVTGSVDTLTTGEYFIKYKVTDSTGNSDSVIRRVVITPDVTKPVFTLNGNDTIKIGVYNSYTEPGYNAVDLPFGTVLTPAVAVSGAVDTAKTGTYPITYTVSDAAGNTVVLKRTVIVMDTIKPLITLVGFAIINHDVQTPYVDSGAVVTDNYDKFLPYTVSGIVNVNVLGSYTLVYKAIDVSGNIADSVMRTVNVVDRKAPVIKLVGNDIIHLARWQNYKDSGYTISDNFYDSTQITVTLLGDWVNGSVEGLYYLQYRAQDPSGNVSFSEKRVIDVRGTNSINDVADGKIAVYPNPNTGKFTVEASQPFGENTTITVINILGVKVYETRPANTTNLEINLESVNSGIYFVNISNGYAVQTTKIIIR